MNRKCGIDGVLLAVLAMTFSLSAEDVTYFPAGGGDIATPAGWGLPAVPTGLVGFTLGASYSASSAVTFSGVRINGSENASSVFDLSAGGITLSGNTDTDFQYLGKGLSATFKGGTVSVGKGFQLSSGTGKSGNTLILDGCAYSQPNSTLYAGYGASVGNTVILTNGASATVRSLEVCNNGGHGNRIEINAGCTVVSGNINSDSYGARADDDGGLLLVRGKGASLSTSGSNNMLYIGYRHDHNTVTVTDGASLTVGGTGSIQFGVANGTSGSSRCGFGSLNVLDSATVGAYYLNMGVNSFGNDVLVSNATVTVGYQTGIGREANNGTNRLVVSGADASFTAARLRVGTGVGCDRNAVRVEDGAKMTALSDCSIGIDGSFNEVCVSNAYLKAQSFVIGKAATSSNNVVRIQGAQATFEQTKNSWGLSGSDGYFGAGAGGLLEFSDRCIVTSPHPAPVIGNLSNGNVVRITGGAQVTGSNPQIGAPPTATAVATAGNRIEILDGAQYTLIRPFVKGVGNGIVISNATLYSSNSQTNTFVVGEVFEGELAEATSNNFIRLEGSAPKIRSAATSAGYRMFNRSRLEFVLPAEPYAEAPLTGSQLHMDATSDIFIDTSALDGVSHGKLRFTLVQLANQVLMPMLAEEVLERANERLAEQGASVGWEGNKLVCTVKGNGGMMIILR